MEIVNIMFEKYGGSQVAGIFRNYLVLAVLIKELMFSLFVMPQALPATDPLPENSTHIPDTLETTRSDGEDLSIGRFLQLMLTVNRSGERLLPQTKDIKNSLPHYESI